MVSPFPLAASGDPALDRRLEWARAFAEAGEREVAIEVLSDLVAQAPHFAAAWFLLAEVREAAGDAAGAAVAYGEARARLPGDPLGAGLRLARLGAAPEMAAMTPDYVRVLFDQYAGCFEESLRGRLSYRGPELLADALDAACRRLGRPMHFSRALDLGCGTGLAAPLLAAVADRVEGVDLSPAMLGQAEQLGLYACLHAGEMICVLARMEPGAFDLILAADVLCYVADLAALFAAVALALARDGLFAVTLETHEGEGLILRETLRYAHGPALLAEAAQACGLGIVSLDAASARTENGVPVPGLVAVLARRDGEVFAVLTPPQG